MLYAGPVGLDTLSGLAGVKTGAADDVEHQDVYMCTSRRRALPDKGVGGHTRAQPLKQPPPTALSCSSMLDDGRSVPGMLA